MPRNIVQVRMKGMFCTDVRRYISFKGVGLSVCVHNLWRLRLVYTWCLVSTPDREVPINNRTHSRKGPLSHMRDLNSYWLHDTRTGGRSGGMEANLAPNSGSIWRWMRAFVKPMRPGPNANVYIPHASKIVQSCSSNSQKLLWGSPAVLSCPQSPSRSAHVQTQCANVFRNAEPIKNNLTTTTTQ